VMAALVPEFVPTNDSVKGVPADGFAVNEVKVGPATVMAGWIRLAEAITAPKSPRQTAGTRRMRYISWRKLV
jgi:hypothetical protein